MRILLQSNFFATHYFCQNSFVFDANPNISPIKSFIVRETAEVHTLHSAHVPQQTTDLWIDQRSSSLASFQ